MLGFDMLRNMTKLELLLLSNNSWDSWETRRWREDLDSKTTLQIYSGESGNSTEGKDNSFSLFDD